MRPLQNSLAILSLFSLAALGIASLALAGLLIAWPLGLSPNAHPLVWKAVLISAVAACASFLVPGLVAVLMGDRANR